MIRMKWHRTLLMGAVLAAGVLSATIPELEQEPKDIVGFIGMMGVASLTHLAQRYAFLHNKPKLEEVITKLSEKLTKDTASGPLATLLEPALRIAVYKAAREIATGGNSKPFEEIVALLVHHGVALTETNSKQLLTYVVLEDPDRSTFFTLDGRGNTLLHVAARTDNAAVYDALIKQKRIDQEQKNQDGKTAKELATGAAMANYFAAEKKSKQQTVLNRATTFAQNILNARNDFASADLTNLIKAISDEFGDDWYFGDRKVGAGQINSSLISMLIHKKDKTSMQFFMQPEVFKRVKVPADLIYPLLLTCYELEKDDQVKGMSERVIASAPDARQLLSFILDGKQSKEVKHELLKMIMQAHASSIDAQFRGAVIAKAVQEEWADTLVKDSRFFSQQVASTASGKQAFMMAVQAGNLAVARALVAVDKDIMFIKDPNNGDTALHAAIRSGNTELVAFIRQTCDLACVNVRNKENKYPVEIADKNNKAMMEALGWKEPEKKEPETVLKEQSDQLSADLSLLASIQHKDDFLRETISPEMISQKIDQAKLFNGSIRDSNGNTILHLAARKGNEELVTYILAERKAIALAFMKNNAEQYPIQLSKNDAVSAMLSSPDIMGQLVGEKVIKNNVAEWYKAGNSAKIELSALFQYDIEHKYALHYAAAGSFFQKDEQLAVVVKQIIASAADYFGNHVEKLAHYLLFQDKKGNTAMHIAAEAGNERVMNVLAAAVGADPDALWSVNGNGDTPLHIAARKGNTAMVEMLMAHAQQQADSNKASYLIYEQMNKQGKTAYNLATGSVRKILDMHLPGDKSKPAEQRVHDALKLQIPKIPSASGRGRWGSL